jgi:putative holliday junction resolvase
LAATDELRLVCSPLETIETRDVVQRVQELHRQSPFDGVVIGKPNLIVSGVSDSTTEIDDVAQKLQSALPDVPLHFVDEGHTSQEASAIQRQSGMKKSKRQEKGSLDAIAASLILQRHLDALSY